MTVTITSKENLAAVEKAYTQVWPTKIDEIAAQTSDRVFCEYLDPTYMPDKEVHVLTYKDLSNAINRLSWWLKQTCNDLDIHAGDVVCFIGYPDMRYHLVLIAAMKTGIKVLFSAPPNGVSAHLKLMGETKCKALFYTKEDPLPQLREAIQVPAASIPSVLNLINPDQVPDMPFTAQWDDIKRQVFAYFHTSGTTGFPKTRPWTYMHLATGGARHADDTFQGLPLTPFDMGSLNRSTPRRMLIGAAMFHISMITIFTASLCRGSVAILAPPHVPIQECTAENMLRWVNLSRCDCMMMFPSKLNPALQNKEYLAALQNLDFIGYGGAALEPVLANKLIPATRLCNLWGGTEFSVLPAYHTDLEDWEYMCFDHESAGLDFRERGPGHFEAVFVRDDSITCPPQAVFAMFPDQDEYATGDLFEPHPSKSHQWRFAGRADDNIILSVAQNINPEPFEKSLLQSCPNLKSATMLGNGRIRPCLIVEFISDDNVETQLEDVWVAMQKAREGMTDYERVDRHRIIVADAQRPVPMNHKGGVRRKDLVELYKDDIDRCYVE